MNIFKNCKTIEELKDEYRLKEMGCETFEWLGKIERDYKERYFELLEKAKQEKRNEKIDTSNSYAI